MRQKVVTKVYTIWLNYPMGMHKSVQVKASSREVAEARALKRNPNAIGVLKKDD